MIPTSRRPAKPAFFQMAQSAVRCACRPGALSLFARQVTPPIVRDGRPWPEPSTTGRGRPFALTSPARLEREAGPDHVEGGVAGPVEVVAEEEVRGGHGQLPTAAVVRAYVTRAVPAERVPDLLRPPAPLVARLEVPPDHPEPVRLDEERLVPGRERVERDPDRERGEVERGAGGPGHRPEREEPDARAAHEHDVAVDVGVPARDVERRASPRRT